MSACSLRLAGPLRSGVVRLFLPCPPLLRFVAVGVAVLMCFCADGHADENPDKRVLVIYSNDRLLPAIVDVDSGLREAVQSAATRRVEFFTEFLDVSRFPDEVQQRLTAAFLQERYGVNKPDAIVAFGAPTARFLTAHPNAWASGVPIILGGVRVPEELEIARDANVASVPLEPDYGATVELILELRPGTRRVFVVSGSSEVDLWLQGQARGELESFRGKVGIDYWSGLSLEELEDFVRKLTPDTALFVLSFLRDRNGHTYHTENAVGSISKISKAPIFTWGATMIGSGVVGGKMTSFHDLGSDIGQVTARVLQGETARQIGRVPPPRNHYIFDAKALERWGIPEQSLPRGSEVRFGAPSAWERYRWHFTTAGGLFFLQTGVLGALLLHRRRRRIAEAAANESENRLRLIADSLPVLIAYIDSGQRYQFNNRVYESWLGFTPEEARGRTVREMVGEENYKSAQPYMERALRGEEVRYAGEAVRRGGLTRYIEGICVPHRDEAGVVRGFCTLILDRTERTRAECEASRAQAELARLERAHAMGSLASAIAHELNQPLTAIQSHVQAARRFLVNDSPELQEVRECLERIVSDKARASEIIDRMQTFLRTAEVRRESLSLNEVVTEAAGLIRIEAVRRGVPFDLDLAENLPPVRGDRVQLQQVLLNLAKNAMETLAAIPPEERRLVIATKWDGHGPLTLLVRDSGAGIDIRALTEVFQPFSPTKEDEFGLGLFLSRSIIEAHGGSLSVRENHGRGNTFVVSLPAEGRNVEHASSVL